MAVCSDMGAKANRCEIKFLKVGQLGVVRNCANNISRNSQEIG